MGAEDLPIYSPFASDEEIPSPLKEGEGSL